MQVIPVIDLKDGQAVHARLGQRDSYRPVHSPLCRSADPLDVVEAFRAVHPFRTVYVADLDAIQGKGDNVAVLERLRRELPDLDLWVDSGLADAAACRAWLARDLGDLVLGSETQSGTATLDALCAGSSGGRIILSLDFQGDRFLGPPALRDDATRWPARVIVMTLARVGSGSGPDLERLGSIQCQAPGTRFFAAGGVRDAEDLGRLARQKVAGVLVASALHDGRIDGAAIARLGDGVATDPLIDR